MAVVGALVFAGFQRPAQSQSSSPAFTAGPSLPFYPVAIGGHIGHGWFPSKGKRGSFTIDVRVRDSGTLPIKRIPIWRFSGFDLPGPPLLAPTGQYAQVTGGGRRIVAGGHQAACVHAPLREGFPSGGSETAGDHRVQGCAERCVRGQAAGTRGAQARLGDAVLFRDGVAPPSPGRDHYGSSSARPSRAPAPRSAGKGNRRGAETGREGLAGSGTRLYFQPTFEPDGLRVQCPTERALEQPAARSVLTRPSAAYAMGEAVSSTPYAVRQTRRDLREVLEPRRAFAQVALRLLGRLAPELLTRSCMPGD